MIDVRNLYKNYGPIEAVKGVSFTLGPAEILGFLGPNGAGKTSIMKILTGYHYPSSGEVVINGLPLMEAPREIKRQIGYLSELNPLYGDLNSLEYLAFVAAAREIPRPSRGPAIKRALELCGIEDMSRRRIDKLSKGYKQRLGLAQAILHDPAILILDEPTSGLDPLQIIEIRKLIKQLGEHKTLILSTHILSEVEAVASRILILHRGRIAAQGTKEEIAATLGVQGEDLSLEDIFVQLTRGEE
ncbi:MAG: ABC transporter ATP-binding protein [Treponema sp.]|nr:ABC transporter ATP-binding protein [Treponema sp.]